VPKTRSINKLREIDRLAELLPPEQRKQYAERFGLPASETVEYMTDEEKRLNTIIASALAKGIQTKDRLRSVCWAMADYTGLPRIPDKAVCEGHVAPFDAFAEVYFEEAGDWLGFANRHGYKTMGDAFLLFLTSATRPKCQSKILGGSEEQSKRVYEYSQLFMTIPACSAAVKDLQAKSMKFRNGSQVSILTQSSKSVLGQHPQKLCLDEIEEFDPIVFRQSLSTTRSFAGIKASIGMTSTHHKRFGIMTGLLKNAAERGIKVYKWCIFEVMKRCRKKSCNACKKIVKMGADGEIVSWRDICKGKARRSRGYYEIDGVIRKFKMLPLDEFKTVWLCNRVSLSGYTFPAFNERIHKSKTAEFDPTWNLQTPAYRFWDFGWSGATCVEYAQRHPVTGQLRFFDESWFTFTKIEDVADVVNAKPYIPAGGWIDVGDIAGKQTHEVIGESDVTMLRKKGVRIRTPRKNPIPHGLMLMNAALEDLVEDEPKVLVHPRCKHLLGYLQETRYPVDPEGRPTSEVPLKNKEIHAGDATRYGFEFLDSGNASAAFGSDDADGDADPDEKRARLKIRLMGRNRDKGQLFGSVGTGRSLFKGGGA